MPDVKSSIITDKKTSKLIQSAYIIWIEKIIPFEHMRIYIVYTFLLRKTTILSNFIQTYPLMPGNIS